MFKKVPTTVEEAIAPLLKAVTDLETVMAQCTSRLTANKDRMIELEKQIEIDKEETDRAMAIAAKIRSITEG